MYTKYSNFVKPCCTYSYSDNETILKPTLLSGEEAKQIYLSEVETSSEKKSKHSQAKVTDVVRKYHDEHGFMKSEILDRDLFLSAENDDIDTIKQALDASPDKIKILDDYGWNLLMIACQANSINVVKELLSRGIDTSVRDKAGNSAQSLIIKNKNYELADILLSYRDRRKNESARTFAPNPDEEIMDFICETCNIKVTANRKNHLSSTEHNLNLSKGKKIPTNFKIPESNRGFQIMLKVGWDKESGLGPQGNGPKYPIKTVQKQDRKGLGHSKNLSGSIENKEIVKFKNRRKMINNHKNNRNIEVNFRRQFY
ncbi:unnamed protein product [Chilo suppressalis]|uniref:G-patch domain-containing protein n=1 Tax=Chilo suppressalis TaxID=168631 RepID=A0ABN8B4Q6_CHISP|nr:unnamed protein product [Chilo suppressalis]